MGIVTMGVPADITLDLARLQDARVFVETGTYKGGTTRWAAQHFATVFTIERSQPLYDQHAPELSRLPGVVPLFGDVRERMPQVLERIGNQPAVFWLDSHWCGGQTAGVADECPLVDELEAIKHREGDLILIDDARLFLSAPPQPHRAEQWPTMLDIARVLNSSPVPRFMQVIDDVIFVVPAQGPTSACLVEHGRAQAAAFWQMFAQAQAAPSSAAPFTRST